LIVLGVGGYFGYKYIANKTFGKIANSFNDATSTATLTATVTSTTTPTSTKTVKATKTASTISDDYIITDSNTRVISDSDLAGLSNWQLKLARNEIYARHGRPFVHKDMQCYFQAKSWYVEDPSATNPTLTTTENKNVATILAYEKKVGSDIIDADTGCNSSH